MPDHRDLLERRAERGTERGLAAVLEAAERHPRPASAEPPRRPHRVVLAVAITALVVAGAVTVGVARTRSTDVVVGAPTDTTAAPAAPTPWVLPTELPAGTRL